MPPTLILSFLIMKITSTGTDFISYDVSIAVAIKHLLKHIDLGLEAWLKH
jgi:hypothetical protein